MYLRIVFLCVFALIMASADAGVLTLCESYVDSDPGQGLGTPLPISPAAEIEFQSGRITSGLTPGMHTLYVRCRDNSGVWSAAVGKPFQVLAMDAGGTRAIAGNEWFIDADPGAGQGMPIVLTPGTEIDFAAAILPGQLAAGGHTLAIRFQNDLGGWSQTASKPFFALTLTIPEATHFIAAEAVITGILTDGTAFDTSFALSSVDSAYDSSYEVTADVIRTGYVPLPGTLLRGNYTLTVRFQDDFGHWLAAAPVAFVVTTGLVIRAAYPTDSDVTLHWMPSELDGNYYYVYRADTFNGVYAILDSTTSMYYVDHVTPESHGTAYYRITAQYVGSRARFEGKRIVPLEAAYLKMDAANALNGN